MLCHLDFTGAAYGFGFFFLFFPAACFVGKGIILEVPICGTVPIPQFR